MRKIGFAVVAIVVLIGTPVLLAMPESMFSETYYSDSTYTTAVGQITWLCTGGTIEWGYATAYCNFTYHEQCTDPFEPDARGEQNSFGCHDGQDNDHDNLTDDDDPDCWS